MLGDVSGLAQRCEALHERMRRDTERVGNTGHERSCTYIWPSFRYSYAPIRHFSYTDHATRPAGIATYVVFSLSRVGSSAPLLLLQ